MDVGGYVLAGGKSLRMGSDKALLELAGRPLVQHAVVKLKRICGDVHLLGNRNELAVYAPLVRDVHAGGGPLSGIEAALGVSEYDWNLFIPVDMPFLPTAFLGWWLPMALESEKGMRIAMLTVDGRPQPALCLLHKDVLPFVKRAMERGVFKLFRVFEEAGRELSEKEGRLSGVFFNLPLSVDQEFPGLTEENDPWFTLTKKQDAVRRLWFANLNTPEEFAEAQEFVEALDT